MNPSLIRRSTCKGVKMLQRCTAVQIHTTQISTCTYTSTPLLLQRLYHTIQYPIHRHHTNNHTTLNMATTHTHPQINQIPHRTLFIQTQTTPNPQALKFIPQGRNILPPDSPQSAID